MQTERGGGEKPRRGPRRHVARVGWVETSGPGEPAQHPSAHLLPHRGEVFSVLASAKWTLPVLA